MANDLLKWILFPLREQGGLVERDVMDSRATAPLWNYKQKSYEVFVTLILLIILNFVVLI